MAEELLQPNDATSPKLALGQIEVLPKEEDPQSSNSDEEETTTVKSKKSLAFYLAFWGLNVMSLVCSLDATTLAVAIPVSSRQRVSLQA